VAFGENSGGYGGTVAAPMVRALMSTWFRGPQPAAGMGREGAAQR
jgi:penicillin-binding protein 2